MKHTFIDLFCGCGGLSKGLEQAGMVCLLGVDSDKHAIETFKRNHPNSQSYLGKIEDLSDDRIKELTEDRQVDLVAGGPLCQGFSTAGVGRIDDPRNFLFKEFVRIVDAISPKAILFENVTGLLAKKNEYGRLKMLHCSQVSLKGPFTIKHLRERSLRRNALDAFILILTRFTIGF